MPRAPTTKRTTSKPGGALASANCSALLKRLRSHRWTCDYEQGVEELTAMFLRSPVSVREMLAREKEIEALKERVRKLEDAIGDIAGVALEYHKKL